MTRAQSLEPIPLQPDPGALRERNVKALVRACIASARSKTTESGFSDSQIFKKNWPHDEVAGMMVRASTSSTTLTSASALAQTIVADLIAATAPVSAGATLLDAGLQFSFGNSAYISVPSFQATANAVSFVGEGTPTPVVQFTLKAPTLEPHKLASIAVLTEEMISSSNVELMVRDALTRSVGLSFDHVLFDANPGDSVRSAGLLNGVAASTASASSDPFEVMIADLTSLAAQVAPVGGPIYFVASPDRVINLKMRAHHELTDFTVLPSSEIEPNEIVCIAVHGLVRATDSMPQIRVTREAALHMNDAPLPISDSGTIATPVESLWQSASVGLNLRFNIDWALRAPAVAWMQGIGW